MVQAHSAERWLIASLHQRGQQKQGGDLRLGLAHCLHGVVEVLGELTPDSDAQAALQVLGSLDFGPKNLAEGLDLLLGLTTKRRGQ